MFKILKFRFTPYLEYKSTTTNIKKVFKSKNFEIKQNFRLEVKFRLKLFNKKISVRSILTVRKNSLSNTPKAYNIYDLAKKIIQINGFKLKESKRAEGIEIKLIGLQPGEKLHEELITAENTLNSTIHPKINSTSLLHKNLDTEKLLAELTISYEKGDEKRFKKAVLDFTA